ncbi:MGH1-like glycoside hydrolase domain-containing protein [Chryseolinea lacunae]|uniref:Glucosidase n=1 Tax=Chryseolinea lacunae TaxID=2801331 RepID=A0ABS1KZ07_9BACT|nr:glucosidase [Chryseolinea lacunae]MBL0744503.1 glucosidase [Chryseolinea lacunae]
MTAEEQRLHDDRDKKQNWRLWGPYLTERQWGTVREDYSPHGNAWEYVSHDAARSKAYRWGEEGIGGISDDKQHVCFSLALWNTKDPILKERLFGLTGNEGNHGEDCKEHYYYLDSTPSHSYMKMLYKYPQEAFPYNQLVDENRRRGKLDPEYELLDTGIFNDNRYFDVFIEYAKADTNDLLIKITVHNRGNEKATVHVLPQIWFRNTWAWGYDAYKPEMIRDEEDVIQIHHKELGTYYLAGEGEPGVLFCENETNVKRLYNVDGTGLYKDGINDYVVNGQRNAVSTQHKGTKGAFHYELSVPAGNSQSVSLRLSGKYHVDPFKDFERVLKQRVSEADSFYGSVQNGIADADKRDIQRQAIAGMLWSKQFFYYNVAEWLKGDPAQPAPPEQRLNGRNHEWKHLNNSDIISMPDKWEYPWYAAWDLAFHTLPIAMVDPEFAKHQLILLTKEWYMHPNGQLPAYEWALGDVNPPVHAWATWRVYKMDEKLQGGKGDRKFLEEVFHKLLLNFTWWVNRKDNNGNNIFQGGFLGMDNIGVFDRSAKLPTGGYIEQSDGTSWMAMFTLNLLRISLELSKENPTYQSLATKFFEHFLYIAGAMTNEKIDLWDEEDEFFYDVLRTPDGERTVMRVHSMVGLIPMFAVEVLDQELFDSMPEFTERAIWFLENRPDLANLISRWTEKGKGARHLLSLLRGHRMKRLLKRMLDETEFLSGYGIRALSRYHLDHPYVLRTGGTEFKVKYTPGESDTSLFGGNSNWRGPIWFPVNFLLIESLQRFHHYYGDDFKVEHPTGSGNMKTLKQIADDLSERLISIFRKDANGRRPVHGDFEKLQTDPHFRDYIPFFEYFHGDSGRGVGATHQTGWTGLVAKLIQPRRKKTQ